MNIIQCRETGGQHLLYAVYGRETRTRVLCANFPLEAVLLLVHIAEYSFVIETSVIINVATGRTCWVSVNIVVLALNNKPPSLLLTLSCQALFG